MPLNHVPHRIERTRNKHSRAVYRENRIVIRLARNLTKYEEREHIVSLLKSMHQKLLEEKRKTLIDPFRPLLQGGQSITVHLATGRKYRFTLHPGKKTFARRIGNTFRIEISPQLRRRALHRLLWRLLSKAERGRITALVACVNLWTVKARIRPVRLAFATSQWGSCSHRGVISINAALLFLPPSVLKYIIVHELVHCHHRNHSRAYWQEVEWRLPSYRRAQAILQKYRLPSL